MANFRLYKQPEADRQRAATHPTVRALGGTPVAASPPTVTVQTGASYVNTATSTITGTLLTPSWAPSTYYPAGAVVLDPTLAYSTATYQRKWQRNTSGTSSTVFDTTEQGNWTVVSNAAQVQNPIRWNATFLRHFESNGTDATGASYTPRAPAQVNGGETAEYAYQPTQWYFDFDWYTAAGALEVPVFDRTQVRFVVDGLYASATPANPITTSDYNWKYVKLSGVTPGFHRIRVEIGSSSYCGGVKIATGDQVFAPSLPASATFCILGDSYIEGATDVSGTTTADIRGYGYQAARLLGFSTYFGLGIAGSGYTLPTNAIYQARIADLVALQPDYALIQGSLNDFGNGQTTVTTAVSAFLTALQAASLPKTRIVFTGDPYYGTSTNLATYNSWIRPLITAAGYSFISTDDWGPGPTAFNGADNVHPTPMGHDYLARRMAAALSKQWGLPL